MKTRHWVAYNNSGMHHVAVACAEAEHRLGHDAMTVDIGHPASWEEALDADIHVAHTDFPEAVRVKITHPHHVVFVVHGTPEHVFENTIDNFNHAGYAPGDGWMLLRHWLRTADATVTFWPRHQAFYQSLRDKSARPIDYVPLGVDRVFWAGGTSHGAFAGEPSVWTSENQHRIKWVLDVLIAWPFVTALVPGARLHAHYIPTNIHRFFVDLANANDAAFKAFLSSATYPHESLRDIWRDMDFFLSPVRYGDHNNLFLQASATGVKTISYAGNVYADYWMPEGDQRVMATTLASIFRGEVQPRADKLPPPDLDDMGRAMVAIYEDLQS